LEKRQLSAKWLKTFEQSGLHVSVPAVPPYKLADWIRQRLQSRSLRVESGVIEVLLENVEGNLLAAAQEIDKLQVLCPDGALTLDTLNRCLADQAKYDAFNLVDVCLKGDQQKALRILDRLQQEGIEPVVVLWALVREVRKLTAVSSMLRSGVSQGEAFKSQQIWRSRESLVGGVLRRINHSQWLSLMDKLAKLDQSIKGQRYDGLGDSWQQLKLFCSELSGGEQRTIFAA
jgi:DNA polymerase-3 subunit delta